MNYYNEIKTELINNEITRRVKEYSKKYTKDELMGIYKEWSQIICNEQCVDDYSYNVGVHKTKNQY